MTNLNVLKPNKIILVVRDFYDWVLSLYFRTLNFGYSWSLSEYIKLNKDALKSWRCADTEIRRLSESIDIALLVMRYEDLNNGSQDFCDRIYAFIECETVFVRKVQYNIALLSRLWNFQQPDLSNS